MTPGRGVSGDSERGKVILGVPMALPSRERGCQLRFSGGYGKVGGAGRIVREIVLKNVSLI